MRLINTKAHGIYDYLMGLVLFMSPVIFDFANGGLAQNICRAVGLCLWITGVLSNYEFGLAKILSLKKHLFLDLFIGFLLAVSPWLCGFSEIVFKPHLVFGLSIIVVSFFTDRVLTSQVAEMMSSKKKVKARNKKDEAAAAAFPTVKFVMDPSEFLAYKSLGKNGILKKTQAEK